MGLIAEETIQQVIAASDIVAVIGSYFQVKRAGSNFRALCPFHSERTPSFIISPARNSFHCFGCGAGGGVIKFVELYEHVSFPDAVRRLAERAGIAVVETAGDGAGEAATRQRKELLSLHREVADWFHELLLSDRAAGPARAYWKNRGLTADQARNWKIGFAPADFRALLEWSRARSIPEARLAEGGLISTGSEEDGKPRRSPWFRFAGRLMFPIRNELGEVIAFSGRSLENDPRAAKYLNSPETPVFNKSRVFFGLDKSRRHIAKSQRAVICEGQIDLITCFEGGIENVVAPLGTAFTDSHARILRRLTDEAILCFDSDSAGHKAAGRAFRELARAGVFVRVVDLPDGEDPDSLIRSEGADAFRQRIDSSRSFLDFRFDRIAASSDLSDPRSRLRAVDDLAADIACLAEKTAQEDAINHASTRLAVDTDHIRRRVASAAHQLMRESRPGYVPGASAAAPMTISSPAIRMLCKLALTDGAARAWMIASGDNAWLDELPEAELLARIWRAPSIDPDRPPTVQAFLSTLSDREQACLSGLLTDEVPVNGADDARAACLHLRMHHLRALIDQTQARLRMPDLPPEMIVSLSGEIVALTHQLRDVKSEAATPRSLVPF